MSREDIENAILGTFLLVNDIGDDLSDIYKLELSIFTSKFRRKVAKRINEVDDDAYGWLSCQIEDSCAGTVYEYEFLEILSQTYLGLAFSKKYHDTLVAKDREDELC